MVLVDEFAALLAPVDRPPAPLSGQSVALTYSRAHRLARAFQDPGPGRRVTTIDRQRRSARRGGPPASDGFCCNTVVVHGDEWTWVDDLIKAFNAHDSIAVGGFMTADVEYRYWSGDRWVSVDGRDSVVQLVDSFDKELSSDFSLEKTFAVISDDGFAVEYLEKGTHDRGSTPTGQRFHLHNVMIGELKAGRISRMTDYSDVVAFRSQTTSSDGDGP